MPAPTPDTLTTSSLHALLASILDYAGLFPPAGLPLDEALPNYARYRQAPEAWMLARFVIPARRLADLAPFGSLFADDPPFRFSVLGTGGPDADAFLDALEADLHAIGQFHALHPGQVQADVLEVRLPTALLGAEEATLQRFFEAVGRATMPLDLALFVEIPIDARVRETAPPVLSALAAHNRVFEAPAGFKMRTGGLEPDAFPAADNLAYTLTACRDAGVHFKATAGLHHPVRAYHESVRARMYGFFNVFGSAVLAVVHRLDEATVRAILLDDAAAHFRFTADAFAWKDLTASPDAIQHIRQSFALSFGSCSFDEPRDDLHTLGLL